MRKINENEKDPWFLVKNRPISTTDKVIYFKGTTFLRSTKPSLHFTK
jgi:hypothetical protein